MVKFKFPMSKSNQRKKVFLTVVHRQIEFACEAIALTAFVSGILVDVFYKSIHERAQWLAQMVVQVGPELP